MVRFWKWGIGNGESGIEKEGFSLFKVVREPHMAFNLKIADGDGEAEREKLSFIRCAPSA